MFSAVKKADLQLESAPGLPRNQAQGPRKATRAAISRRGSGPRLAVGREIAEVDFVRRCRQPGMWPQELYDLTAATVPIDCNP